jgi:hypothetical protein
VDHRRRQVSMTEQLLDDADVAAAPQQVGGERVAQGMAGHALVDPAGADGVV